VYDLKVKQRYFVTDYWSVLLWGT